MSRTDAVRDLLDEQVASGHLPGYAAAVRCGGTTEVLVGGVLTLGGDEPTRPDTPFRLSSVTKPIAGVLALSLVEQGVVGLDDPVDRWLPELAEPVVLRDRCGPLPAAEPARGPITVRHLLTATAGFGCILEESPLQDAMVEQGLFPSAFAPDLDPDAYLARLGALPLAAQPGSAWLYHTTSDVLGVLLSRAAGRPVSALLAEHVTGPLAMASTGFWTDAARLPTSYQPDDTGTLQVFDPPAGRFAAPPRFESLATGLVSTCTDVLTLLVALVEGGAGVLSPASASLMTTGALTEQQRADAFPFLALGMSWGVQCGVDVGQDPSWGGAGRFGWDGGTGTSAWADPARGTAAVLLTSRGMTGPDDAPVPFWRAVAQLATP